MKVSPSAVNTMTLESISIRISRQLIDSPLPARASTKVTEIHAQVAHNRRLVIHHSPRARVRKKIKNPGNGETEWRGPGDSRKGPARRRSTAEDQGRVRLRPAHPIAPRQVRLRVKRSAWRHPSRRSTFRKRRLESTGTPAQRFIETNTGPACSTTCLQVTSHGRNPAAPLFGGYPYRNAVPNDRQSLFATKHTASMCSGLNRAISPPKYRLAFR